VPDGAEGIDASQMTVMLGLIDAHVHFNGSRNHIFAERIMPTFGLRLLRAAEDTYDALKARFTTMHCMHGAQALDLKKGIAESTVKGPRIKAVGHALSQTFVHGDTYYFDIEYGKMLELIIADGVDECREQMLRTDDYLGHEGALVVVNMVKVSEEIKEAFNT